MWGRWCGRSSDWAQVWWWALTRSRWSVGPQRNHQPVRTQLSSVIFLSFIKPLSPFSPTTSSVWRSSLWSSTSNSVACCPSSRRSLDTEMCSRHHGKTKIPSPRTNSFPSGIFTRNKKTPRSLRPTHSLMCEHVVVVRRPLPADRVVDDLCEVRASLDSCDLFIWWLKFSWGGSFFFFFQVSLI